MKTLLALALLVIVGVAVYSQRNVRRLPFVPQPVPEPAHKEICGVDRYYVGWELPTAFEMVRAQGCSNVQAEDMGYGQYLVYGTKTVWDSTTE